MLMAATFVGCSTPPTTPTPPPTPPVTPPAVVTAPTIKALSIGATRTEVDREVTLTADVEDAEKAPAALTYIWSADVGTFTGTGMSVTWRLPKGAAPTPVNVVIRLTVVEPYQVLENGQLVNREHRVTRDTEPVRVHDSAGEITRMVRTFLIDYFGNMTVSPDACLVDFSNSCPGKAAERDDIDYIREYYQSILEVRVDSTQVTLNSAGTFADVFAPCLFRAVHKMKGYEASSGDCVLTAVYEQQRWWLCSSSYLNSVALPASFSGPIPRRERWTTAPEPGTFPFYFR
jgi:hypothetical protein